MPYRCTHIRISVSHLGETQPPSQCKNYFQDSREFVVYHLNIEDHLEDEKLKHRVDATIVLSRH